MGNVKIAIVLSPQLNKSNFGLRRREHGIYGRKVELNGLLFNLICFIRATSFHRMNTWSLFIPFVSVTCVIHFDILKDEMKESSKLLI